MVSPTSPPKVKIMGLGNNREVNDGAVGSVMGPTGGQNFTSSPIFSQSMTVSNKADGGVAGVCGLGNLGNTCFMAAGVQCLVATPPLATALMATLPHGGLAPLTRELAQLTQLIWSGEYSALRPTKFKDSLGKHYPQFNDYRQHDCQEFLALLLDGLHEQMNSALTKKDLVNQGDSVTKCCDQGKAVNIDRENEEEFGSSFISKNNQKNEGWEGEKCSRIFDQPHLSLPGTSSFKPNDNGDCVSQSATPYTQLKVNSLVYPDNPNTLLSDSLNDSDSEGELIKSKMLEISEMSLDNAGSSDSETKFTIENDKESLDILSEGSSKETLNNISLGQLNNSAPRSSNLNLNSPNRICQQNLESSVVCNHVGSSWLTSLEDILKESKTSNVNVLGKESLPQAPNNAIRFDSEKYPRSKDIRKKSDFEYNVLGVSGKRSSWIVPHGLDLKRVKLEDDEDKNRPPSPPSPHKYLEKNIRLEEEMKERGGEAEKAWRSHLANNSSIIVSTFQGQLKSQVVCSVCQYVSITYEPFMYLSVPLPNAMKKQLRVTFVSKTSEITEVVLEVNKNDSVQNMKDKLVCSLDLRTKGSVIVISEVLNNHIAKLLDENVSIGSINDSNREIYAFEVITINSNIQSKNEEQIPVIEQKMEEDINAEVTCAICLENKDTSIKKHINCTFLICDSCVTPLSAHCNGSITCPVCRYSLNSTCDLISINSSSVPIRDVKVSLVYRVEEGDDVRLIGHPSLVKVPNLCTSEWLHSSIASFIPYSQQFSLKIVDGQGLWCRKCLYAEHCRGCLIDASMRLNANDTLAVSFNVVPSNVPLSSPSLPLPVPPSKNSLSLYDCIDAFSQSEVLDENNPWFCPSCKKNQCATKSLSIWRFPQYLIVYLKRFVFHNHTSTKIEERVEFPLRGLDFADGMVYDLYACVCHVGGVSAGHYTTYTLHSETEEWHYFNDSFVTKQSPQEKDFSSAYILFYRKRIS